ncbi:hypothetical protein [Streptomyces sp. enrichment culture]|uniref:hypothetical protein n=1 Tax=Streptomyces sp. enrichment culture TaxID=1795815 RepID=UPI003F57B813
MTSEAAQLLMAAGRDLRLRRFMGPLPFEVDQWMRQDLECDLPLPKRLDDGTIGYHFEVRDPDYYMGTYFRLVFAGQGRPYLTVGQHYPADLDGWRAVVAHLNRFSGDTLLPPRKYIWLFGHEDLARQADAAYQARLDEVMTRLGWDVPEPQIGEPVRRRRRWWPWGRG